MKIAAAFSFFCVGASAFAPIQLTTTTRGATSSNSAMFMAGPLNRQTGRSQLDPQVISKYDSLEFPKEVVLAEYVWVDADGSTRSKTRTLPAEKVRK